MEPEISRRCRTCGASVRSRAGFCPQCGTPFNPNEALAATAPAVEMQETLPGQSEEVIAVANNNTAAPEVASATTDIEEAAAVRPTATAAGPVPVLTEERDMAEAVTEESEAEVAAVDAGEPSQPTRRHRVKVAARDAVEGKIAPRVEKLRHASTVVLDEAADDPGLRFVLVAAVLILLSLGLLLLSQILD